ncbi:MAG TPA: hypothetical protein DFS52_20735 [Myxococcales bacterium]|jgi:formate-dependent nitrite reductase membrane component NrfD|nr:hypothetical protein [Myxococcales bacterium]
MSATTLSSSSDRLVRGGALAALLSLALALLLLGLSLYRPATAAAGPANAAAALDSQSEWTDSSVR